MKQNNQPTRLISDKTGRKGGKKGRVADTTPLIKKLFLEAYGKHGTMTGACRAIKLERATVKLWVKNDPEFLKGMVEAKYETVDSLKETAIERARGGSDPLLMFLLKALAPDEFSERIRHDFAVKTLDAVVDEVLQAIRANVPEFCPHCRTSLEIAPAIARELLSMSERLTGRVEERA